MMDWFVGKKTYIIATAMLAFQVLRYYFEGTPIEAQHILEAFGLATLRAGIAKV